MEKENKEVLKRKSQERIKELINDLCRGKQQIFADMCGISKYSVSQYVSGSNCPGNVTAAKIGAKCLVNPLWVMGFDVPKEMKQQERFIGEFKKRPGERGNDILYTVTREGNKYVTIAIRDKEAELLKSFSELSETYKNRLMLYAQALKTMQDADAIINNE